MGAAKVFLFNDSRSQNNWGCRATTSALCNLIAEAGGEISAVFELEKLTTLKQSPISQLAKSALSAAPKLRRASRRLGWWMEKRRGVAAGRAWSIADFEPLAQLVLSGKAWRDEVEALRKADVMIVNGEGSIYDREQKGILTLFFCYFAKKYMGKPVALVNHSAELSDSILHEVAAEVYPMLDDVVFREPISTRNWRSLARYSDDCYAPDAAFSLRPSNEADWRRVVNQVDLYSIWPDRASIGEDPYICVTGSSSLMREGFQSGTFEAFEGLVQRMGRLKHQIVLVGADSTDELFLRPLAQKHQLAFVPASMPTPLGLQLLANARCLVGGRWHPAILAATGGTPTVGFSANMPKIAAVLEMLELDQTVFNVSDLGSRIDDIVDLTERYVQQGDVLRRRVQTIARQFGEDTRRHVRILSRI